MNQTELSQLKNESVIFSNFIVHSYLDYLERINVLYFTDTLRNKSPLIRKSSSNSEQMSPGTTQQQSNISNNQQGTATNGTVLFEYSYLDHMGIVQPLSTVSPCLLNYFGLRPQLSVVREDSREQQAEMESTDSRDQIQFYNTAVSDLNLDSNFEVTSVSSTPYHTVSAHDSLETLVWFAW